MFINRKKSWFSDQLEENIKALEKGDYSRIPWIFCVFSEQHTVSKQIAAQALSCTLNQMNFDEIIRIDEQMRQTTSMEWSIDWKKKRIEDFFTPKMSYTERRAVIVFASFNPNGFIREKAVLMMKDYDNTLPYIILRQNDWVLKVRQTASLSFNERLQKLSNGELLTSLPFAEKLKLSTRGSHGEYTKLFFDKLASPNHRADLMNGLQSKNIRTRRICINALLETSKPNANLALEHLLKEPDPFLRSMLFKKLCLLQIQMHDIARKLLNDKFPVNRVLALQYLYNEGIEDIEDIATILLLDKNASVRGLAREILQEYRSGFDFRSFYLTALNNSPASAIAGLGETGEKADTQHIDIYLGDNRIAVVRATLITLLKLDKEKYKKNISEMLNDSRVGIVKTAQQLILKHSIQDYDLTQNIFWNTPYEHTKIKCAIILFSASKWHRLIYMLEALSSDVDNVQSLTLLAIKKWTTTFNRSQIQINEQQMKHIFELIENLNNILPESMRKELLFLVR